MTQLQQDSYSQQAEKRPPRSRAEWISFSISLLIVGILASLVVYVWATDRARPAALNIERTEPIRITDGKFYIPFDIVNSGGETVESVQVIAELQRNGEVIESGDLHVDFLSQGEKESGTFVFRNNPQNGELVLRVSSYKVP